MLTQQLTSTSKQCQRSSWISTPWHCWDPASRSDTIPLLSYREQAWGKAKAQPRACTPTSALQQKGRVIPALLLQASATDAGLTNHPSFCRQTSKYKLFQARIGQQGLFFNVLAENRTGL